MLSLVRGQRRGLAAAGKVVVGAAGRRSRLQSKAALEMTETAAARIKDLLDRRRKKEDVVAVRIGIKSRGCNGLSYTMNYAAEKAKLEEEVRATRAPVPEPPPLVSPSVSAPRSSATARASLWSRRRSCT
jgi:hypothetical protein